MDIHTPKFGIHVFGDSHSRLYASKHMTDYICNVYYVGAITMFRIGRDGLLIDDLKQISKNWYAEYIPNAKPQYKHLKYPSNDTIQPGDYVIFVFGEIDVRNHLLKQRDRQHRPINELVTDLAAAYVSVILQNKVTYPNTHLGIQSIIPPISRQHVKDLSEEYPDYGTIEERIVINRMLNAELEELCRQNSIMFFDPTSYYENNYGSYPLTSVAQGCLIGELDVRIKDSNVHVDMKYPEGYVYAMKMAGVPSNIRHYTYNNVCKYPSPFNMYQREAYYKVRLAHYTWVALMLTTLFVPYQLIFVPLTLWGITILMNLVLANGDCFWNYIEFRMSNCNDKSLTNEIGISKKYAYTVVSSIYILVLMFFCFRIYFQK